jgi:hypothetical protein
VKVSRLEGLGICFSSRMQPLLETQCERHILEFTVAAGYTEDVREREK